jgi:dTMP kinase
MADHVEDGAFERADLRAFRVPFLEPIFAEMANAGCMRGLYGVGAERFCDGNQPDFVVIATCTRRRLRDPLAHARDRRFHRRKVRRHGLNFTIPENSSSPVFRPVAALATEGYTVPPMSPRGKLLALEGIDGAGKRTQVELLAETLRSRAVEPVLLSFPCYQSFFGAAITRYLTGEFGRLDQVDAHFSALLYAGDRLESKSQLESALAAGRLVIADRYVASNLAHQGARVGAGQRAEFLAWIRRLEYEVFGLPHEDLILYLRVPVEESARRTALRGQRLTHDIQESDQSHLQQASAVYDELAKDADWAVVEGYDPARGEPRSAEDVHREILALVERRLLGNAGDKRAGN